MKCASERTLPLAPSRSALASRSKSCPLVVRASQPSPTRAVVRLGASLLREMLPPLASVMLTVRAFPGVAGSEGDAEVAGDARQARGVALAHGPELPLGAVAVQLAEHHRGLGRRVLRQ